VATKEVPPADVAAPGDREATAAPVTGDIRRSRPYIFASTPLRNLLFRGASVVALVAIDLVAVGFALYTALALREVYYGHSPILWGVLWTAEGNWLPFVALVTVLVFWQAGLYAERERGIEREPDGDEVDRDQGDDARGAEEEVAQRTGREQVRAAAPDVAGDRRAGGLPFAGSGNVRRRGFLCCHGRSSLPASPSGTLGR